MRKIINSAFVSLDGVTADPGSWAIFDPYAAEEAVQACPFTGWYDYSLTSFEGRGWRLGLVLIWQRLGW